LSCSTVIGRLFAIEYITAFFLRMPFEDSRKYLSLNEHLIEKGGVPSEDFQVILINLDTILSKMSEIHVNLRVLECLLSDPLDLGIQGFTGLRISILILIINYLRRASEMEELLSVHF
jgi:hypothetical protein